MGDGPAEMTVRLWIGDEPAPDRWRKASPDMAESLAEVAEAMGWRVELGGVDMSRKQARGKGRRDG